MPKDLLVFRAVLEQESTAANENVSRKALILVKNCQFKKSLAHSGFKPMTVGFLAPGSTT